MVFEKVIRVFPGEDKEFWRNSWVWWRVYSTLHIGHPCERFDRERSSHRTYHLHEGKTCPFCFEKVPDFVILAARLGVRYDAPS